jgi:MFS family permease
VAIGVIAIFNSLFSSSLPSSPTGEIAKCFHITNQSALALPVSLYQIGFMFGALLSGPLSETIGRKIVIIIPFGTFIILTIGCALAPTWPILLALRWGCGLFASSHLAVTVGIYADIYHDPRARGRANALFLAVSTYSLRRR